MDVNNQTGSRRKGPRWSYFFTCVFMLVMLDQCTKMMAATHLKDHSVVLIPGVLQLTYLENRGAAFSLLQGQQVFFYIITVVIILAVLYFYAKLPEGKKYRALKVTAVFLTAGAFGNLVDRMTLHYVRDFIYFVIINFPIFNVADIYVTCSAIALVILMLFVYRDDDFSFLKRKKKDESR